MPVFSCRQKLTFLSAVGVLFVSLASILVKESKLCGFLNKLYVVYKIRTLMFYYIPIDKSPGDDICCYLLKIKWK